MKILVTAKRVPDPEQKVKLKGTERRPVRRQLAAQSVRRVRRRDRAAPDRERLGRQRARRRGDRRVDRPQGRAAAAALGAGHGRRQGGPRRRRPTTSSTPRWSRARCRSWSSARSPTWCSWASWPPTASRTTSGSASPATSAGRRRRSPAPSRSSTAARRSSSAARSTPASRLKKVTLPAVVTVDLRIVAPHAVKNGKTAADHAYAEGPRYASLKGIMAAKKKPIEETTLAGARRQRARRR